MKTLYLSGALAALLLAPGVALAQSGSVGIGTAAPNASAVLDLSSTTKGLLIPRLDSAARVAIASPATGLLVFQTGPRPGFYYYGGSAWLFLPDKARGGDNLGNHAATQDLNLQGNALTGTGASIGSAVGLGVRADGGLNIGQNTTRNNVLIGYQAGAAVTGPMNQFIGYQAGNATTTGFNNYFSGYRSGYRTTSGNGNQFTGFQSGYNNTTGSANLFDGLLSGYNNTTGDFNQFSGFQSGQSNTTGNNNWAFGYMAGPTIGNLTNAGALGYKAKVSQSNSLVLGGTGAEAVNVGIGTTAPTATLDVNGPVRLRTLTSPGLLTNDASGTLGTTPMPTPESTTAGSGLTATGTELKLGGDLSQSTVLVQNGNPFALTGTSSTASQISQLDNSFTAGGGGGAGQSFTLPAGVLLTGVDVFGGNSASTFTLYQGNPGGTVLQTQTVTYSLSRTTHITFSPAVRVPTGGTYSFTTGNLSGFPVSGSDVYSGGSYYNGTTAVPSRDLKFVVYYHPPVASLYADSDGSVGIGTTTPTATLDVAGSVRLRSLSTPGVVTTDGSGNLGSVAASGLGDNLGNHTATQSLNLANYLLVGQAGPGTTPGSAGLRIDEAGRVGLGTTAPAAPLEVQAGPALTGSNTGTETELRLTRPGTSGTKWPASAELALGTYATGVSSQSQLDFRLGNDGNAAADQTVLTLRGDGRVNVPGKVTTSATGAANMLAAAYGNVYSSNNLYNASGNATLTSTHPTAGEYTLVFSGPLATADFGSTAVSLTLFNGPGFISFSGAGAGRLLVRTYNPAGTLTDRGFSFVVFQP
ncbi:hypothetical protein Q5H93_00375 [Hymenobacter sp. ASUV-10]|uniref:Uncharacterized protein n=1 Tax=Hymenobacter aranciens TaxID=3063996 RepID=A0ABT9B4N8_9BACT|nr:hypothetical protein [Hymenobacter sp. ASUV-10]MDO7873170.1 hypothetical protein [Hymenobacter sp. ASUV-10]